MSSTQILPDNFSNNESSEGSLCGLVGLIITETSLHEVRKGSSKIGRDAELCSIVLESDTISKIHCVIESEGVDSTFIYDVGSTNRTKLGKIYLKPHVRYKLEHGCSIMFGNLIVKFVVPFTLSNNNISMSHLEQLGNETLNVKTIFDLETQVEISKLPDNIISNPTLSKITEKFIVHQNNSQDQTKKLNSSYENLICMKNHNSTGGFQSTQKKKVIDKNSTLTVSNNHSLNSEIDEDLCSLKTQCPKLMLSKNESQYNSHEDSKKHLITLIDREINNEKSFLVDKNNSEKILLLDQTDMQKSINPVKNNYKAANTPFEIKNRNSCTETLEHIFSKKPTECVCNEITKTNEETNKNEFKIDGDLQRTEEKNFVSSKLIFNEEAQEEYSNNETSNMVDNCKTIKKKESIETGNFNIENFKKSVLNLPQNSINDVISKNNNEQRHIKNDRKSVSIDKDCLFLQYNEITYKDVKDNNDGVNCVNKLTSSESDDNLNDDTQSYLEITLQNSNELNKFNHINSSFTKKSIESNKSEVKKNLINNSLSQILNVSINQKPTDYNNSTDSDSSESFISSPNLNKKESFFLNIHNRYAKKTVNLVRSFLPSSPESSQDFIETATKLEYKICNLKPSTTSCVLVNSFPEHKNNKSLLKKNFIVPETPDDDNTLSDLELIEDTPIFKNIPNIRVAQSNTKKNFNEPLEKCKTYLGSESNSEDSNDSYVFQIDVENEIKDKEKCKEIVQNDCFRDESTTNYNKSTNFFKSEVFQCFNSKNNQIVDIEVIDDVLPIESSKNINTEINLNASISKNTINDNSTSYKTLINEKSSIFRELENNFINFFERRHKLNVDPEVNQNKKENKENRSFERGNQIENCCNFDKDKCKLKDTLFHINNEEEENRQYDLVKKNSMKNTNENQYLSNYNFKSSKIKKLFNSETTNCLVQKSKKSPLKRRNSNNDEVVKNCKKSKIEEKSLNIDQNIKMASTSKTNKLFGELELLEKDSWKTRLRRSRCNTFHDQNYFENTCLNIAFTGFDNFNLDKIIINLGGNKTNDIMNSHVLITDRVRRTVKFLCAIGLSLPITSPRWLYECNKANKFLNPWHFILKCEESEQKWNFNLEKTLEKSKKKKILDGFIVFATPSVTPPVKEILAIAECCGAVSLPDKPKKWCKEIIVVSCSEDRKHWPSSKIKSVKIVHSEFILRGILQQKLDFETYKLI